MGKFEVKLSPREVQIIRRAIDTYDSDSDEHYERFTKKEAREQGVYDLIEKLRTVAKETSMFDTVKIEWEED